MGDIVCTTCTSNCSSSNICGDCLGRDDDFLDKRVKVEVEESLLADAPPEEPQQTLNSLEVVTEQQNEEASQTPSPSSSYIVVSAVS